MLWGNEASVLVGDFLLGQAFRMMVEVGSLRALDILSSAAATIAEGEVMQLAAAKIPPPRKTNISPSSAAKTPSCLRRPARSGPSSPIGRRPEQTACRSVGMNLGIAFQLVDDVLDYGGKGRPNSARTSRTISAEGKITLPVVLAFRRGNDSERAFLDHALERGENRRGDLDHAIGLMTKHRALEDTINRAQHYGRWRSMQLALFPASPMRPRQQVVAFCLASRTSELVMAGLSRPSTFFSRIPQMRVDARDKPGHDELYSSARSEA